MILVTLQFSCGGCFKEVDVKAKSRVRQEFRGISGRPWGFGSYIITPTIEKLVEDSTPEGWVVFDLIGCTYCPECWADIDSDAQPVAEEEGMPPAPQDTEAPEAP